MLIKGHILSQYIDRKTLKLISGSKKKGKPKISVIYQGDDPTMLAYIRQKKIKAKSLGAEIDIIRLPDSASKSSLVKTVSDLNNNNLVDGIIIQRPLNITITKNALRNLVTPQKDIDGFLNKSPYYPPLYSACMDVLKYIYKITDIVKLKKILNKKSLLVIGRGESGGGMLIKGFKKDNINVYLAHSKTKDLNVLIKKADIIMSAVGKTNIVRHELLNPKQILIGIGINRSQGNLETDYIQEGLEPLISFFTPVPGGIGPLNVSRLFYNLALSFSGKNKKYSGFIKS